MFYNILYPLHTKIAFFNIFRYITFRAACGIITSFLIFFIFAPYFIKYLQNIKIGQHIQKDGPKDHLKKEGTPTMGGLLIFISFFISSLLWLDLTNFYVLICLSTASIYAAIGFLDDFLKLKKTQNEGLSAKQKFTLQFSFAIIISIIIYTNKNFDHNIIIPFFKNVTINLGFLYIFFASFIITGTSNAVNLTDGLDGLAIGSVIVIAFTYAIFAYISGHYQIAAYLQILNIAGTGELAIVCSMIIGSGLGFLWFNAHPAQIFMGDVGSLFLGGLIGVVAILTKQEVVLLIAGGLFVLEAVSVIIQVSYFRYTKGKRIFKMSPLHHHFELKGWSETKVVIRFWIVAIIFSLIALTTLKIR